MMTKSIVAAFVVFIFILANLLGGCSEDKSKDSQAQSAEVSQFGESNSSGEINYEDFEKSNFDKSDNGNSLEPSSTEDAIVQNDGAFEYYFPGASCVMTPFETLPLYIGNFSLDYVEVTWYYQEKEYEKNYYLSSEKSNIKCFNILLPDELKAAVTHGDLLWYKIKMDKETELFSSFIIEGEGSVNFERGVEVYSYVYLRRGLKIVCADGIEPKYMQSLLNRIDKLPGFLLFGGVTIYASADYNPNLHQYRGLYNGASVFIVDMNNPWYTEGVPYEYNEYLLAHELAHNLQQFTDLDNAGVESVYFLGGSGSSGRISEKWNNDAMRHYINKQDSAPPYLDIPSIMGKVYFGYEYPAVEDLADAWAYWALDHHSEEKALGLYPEYFKKVEEYIKIAKKSISLLESLE